MNFVNRPGPAEIGAPTAPEAEENVLVLARGSAGLRHFDNADGEASADSLRSVLGRVAETSTREIDNLIDELRTLRKKLQADSNRIQRDIASHAELSQQVMQLTKIISESVQKLPSALRDL
jgi:vacuolar-type H+-ATPase subunit I/STV1